MDCSYSQLFEEAFFKINCSHGCCCSCSFSTDWINFYLSEIMSKKIGSIFEILRQFFISKSVRCSRIFDQILSVKMKVNTSISTLLEFEMLVLPASSWDAQKTSVLWTSHRLFRWTKRKALMPPRQPPAQFSSLQQSNLDLYNPPPLVPCNVRIEVVSSREAKVHSNFLFSNESQIKFVSISH